MPDGSRCSQVAWMSLLASQVGARGRSALVVYSRRGGVPGMSSVSTFITCAGALWPGKANTSISGLRATLLIWRQTGVRDRYRFESRQDSALILFMLFLHCCDFARCEQLLSQISSSIHTTIFVRLSMNPCLPPACMVAIFALAMSYAQPAYVATMPTSAQLNEATRTQMQQDAFVENAGQWDEQVAFRKAIPRGALWITREGRTVYSLDRFVKADTNQSWSIVETFVGSNAAKSVRPLSTGASRAASVFISEASGPLGIYARSFDSLSFGEVYPGVTALMQNAAGNVEKIFTVAPWSDPRAIHIQVEGATMMRVSAQGDLIIETGHEALTFTAPIAFQQTANGERESVVVAYALDELTHRYGFAVGAYDMSRELVIDPLIRATYLGGTAFDYLRAFARHPTNSDFYVVGGTSSTNFPGTAGGAQATNPSANSALVVRISADLSTVVQSTYFGGGGRFEGMVTAIHPVTGEIYVGGNVQSPVALPGRTGGAQATAAGSSDGFVARFPANLQSVLQSTYIGSPAFDDISGLLIHPINGDIYVAGSMYGNGTQFGALPALAGGARVNASLGDVAEGFVIRINPALTTFAQSTLVGGSGSSADNVAALTVETVSGDILAAGYTDSADLQGTAGAAFPTLLDAQNLTAFVQRLNPALKSVVRSTYLPFAGGSSRVGAIAQHPTTNDIYVAGLGGDSDGTPTLPKSSGAAQSVFGGGFRDGFVARFDATLSTLLRATWLGGSGVEQVNAMLISPSPNEIVIAGSTQSTNFPGVGGGAQSLIGNPLDDHGFISRVSPSLDAVLQSTYFGGNGSEIVFGVHRHPTNGDIYVVGYTDSSNLKATTGAAQSALAGTTDGFIARFSSDLKGTTCDFDVNGNGKLQGASDGTMLLRAMLGMRGTAVTAGIPVEGSRTTWASIQPWLASACGTDFTTHPPTLTEMPAACGLDIDGDGQVLATSDGLILLRMMLGLNGSAVTQNAIRGAPPRADWNSIRSYVNGTCNANF